MKAFGLPGSRSLGAAGALAAAIVFASCTTTPAPDVEALSEHWVIEHHRPWNPDGRYRTYLARRDAAGLRRVSGVLRDRRYLNDDCVAFIDGQGAVYGVCGNLPPLFVGLLKGGEGTVNAEALTVEAREVSIAEIKSAAQKVDQQRAGGAWLIQREAFSPPDYERLGIPRFLSFREDPERGTYRAEGPMLGYRYVEDDCLLQAYAGVLITRQDDGTVTGKITVTANCGRREEVIFGSIERLSDLAERDELSIDGELVAVNTLKERALAAPLR